MSLVKVYKNIYDGFYSNLCLKNLGLDQDWTGPGFSNSLDPDPKHGYAVHVLMTNQRQSALAALSLF
jgi:hypothetical protein